jgi:hypothetical protein
LPEVHHNYGVTLAELGRYHDAITAFDKALEMHPKSSETTYAREAALAGLLHGLVKEGTISWGGGKPKGLDEPVVLSSGPSLSDYIAENRR